MDKEILKEKIAMKLILYSDQIENNRTIDFELLRIIDKPNPKLAYVSSCTDHNRFYYAACVNYYQGINIKQVDYYDLDCEYDEDIIDQIFGYDVIHLSGGNTFYFLDLMRKRQFIPKLLNYLNKGGILVGVSAGSILMTQTIEIARMEDEDVVGSPDTKALGLVDFEILPHMIDDEEHFDYIKEYAKQNKVTVYACYDGDGIVVIGNVVKLIGNVITVNSRGEIE